MGGLRVLPDFQNQVKRDFDRVWKNFELVNSRFDDLEKSIGERLTNLDSKITKRLDAIENKLDIVLARLNGDQS